MTQYTEQIRAQASRIKCIITDVDGVLTDGAIIYDNAGMEYKHFNVKDGQIIKHLKEAGILVGVITGRDSDVVRLRCEELKMNFHHHGIKDKGSLLKEILTTYKMQLPEVAYIGDDLNDLPILSKVGLAATPQDGHDKLDPFVDIRTKKMGGQGVLREVADLIIESKGLYPSIIEKLVI